jgi:hypothetical protein
MAARRHARWLSAPSGGAPKSSLLLDGRESALSASYHSRAGLIYATLVDIIRKLFDR